MAGSARNGSHGGACLWQNASHKSLRRLFFISQSLHPSNPLSFKTVLNPKALQPFSPSNHKKAVRVEIFRVPSTSWLKHLRLRGMFKTSPHCGRRFRSVTIESAHKKKAPHPAPAVGRFPKSSYTTFTYIYIYMYINRCYPPPWVIHAFLCFSTLFVVAS